MHKNTISTMLRYAASVFSLVLVIFSIYGCGNQETSTSSNDTPTSTSTSATPPVAKAISVYLADDGTITSVMLGNNIPISVSNTDEYANLVERWIASSENIENPISLEMKDADELATSKDLAKVSPLYVKVPKTDLGVRVDFHRHYVGGCIKRNNVWHANLAFNYYRGSKQGQEITNIHLPVWKDGSKVCAGLYVTPSEYCTQNCGDLNNAKKKAVQTIVAALSAYVSYSVATAVAETIVPIVFAAALL